MGSEMIAMLTPAANNGAIYDGAIGLNVLNDLNTLAVLFAPVMAHTSLRPWLVQIVPVATDLAISLRH
jgi:hypothetical protein